MDEHEQADAMSNETLPGDPTRPQTFETQPLGSSVADNTASVQDKLSGGDAKSPDGKAKKSFNPWRFEAITLSPEVRRELIQMEVPRIPEDQLYHSDSATTLPSPSQGEESGTSADAPADETARRADTLRNLRAVPPVSFVRPALSPLVKLVLLGLALGALVTVSIYLLRTPDAAPGGPVARNGHALPSEPAQLRPPAEAAAPAPPTTGSAHLAAPSSTAAQQHDVAPAELTPKAEASARSSKKSGDRTRALGEAARPAAPPQARTTAAPPLSPPAPATEPQDNGNWFKIRD